jgi:hypothetical protein
MPAGSRSPMPDCSRLIHFRKVFAGQATFGHNRDAHTAARDADAFWCDSEAVRPAVPAILACPAVLNVRSSVTASRPWATTRTFYRWRAARPVWSTSAVTR